MSSRNKGILFIILSSLCFAMMSLFVQLSGDLPFMQKSLFRNIVALAVSFAIIIKNKIGFSYKKENFKFLMLRAIFGTIGLILNFYSIDRLILSDATMLNKLSPFFVILFSFLILKESIKIWQLMAIVVAFIGALFIINPDMILGLLGFTNLISEGSGVGGLLNLPALGGFMGAMSAGMAYAILRLLTLRGENGTFIVFFFSAFSCIVTLPFFILQYQPMEFMQVVYLLLAGLFASFGQFALTTAYSNAPAKEISVFDYSQIIFSAILGYVVFGQTPDKISFFGYFIIFSTALFIFIMSNPPKRKSVQTAKSN